MRSVRTRDFTVCIIKQFREGHKILRKRPYDFDVYLSKCQNHEEDYANFCGLLRKAELYPDRVDLEVIPVIYAV